MPPENTLRTLKDIEKTFAYLNEGEGILLERIKAEAIKWVKHYEHLEYIEQEAQVKCQAEIQWIIYFFNITEEDLANSEEEDNIIQQAMSEMDGEDDLK